MYHLNHVPSLPANEQPEDHDHDDEPDDDERDEKKYTSSRGDHQETMILQVSLKLLQRTEAAADPQAHGLDAKSRAFEAPEDIDEEIDPETMEEIHALESRLAALRDTPPGK